MKCLIVLSALAVATLASPVAKSNILMQPIEEMGDYFQGDMVLTESQRRAFFNGRTDSRTGLLNERFRWPNNNLVYDFANDVNQEQKDYIELALRNISASTCLTFSKRTNEKDYVKVTTSSEGCSSNVGRVGGMQMLRLANNEVGSGCFRFGTVIHEFIHALGFYHAQSAYTRDDYVLIKWENIQKGTEFNFEKEDSSKTTMFNLEYDYGSVMHYSNKAFSINDEDTIVPLQDGVTIGQRERMSELDIKRLNQMYNCPDQ
uniref:Metalloendopeptidase n=1 Tax=Lutzomyia longipalpis TaxID=7200 RepID=A8CW49_LUTLO|nr:astacin-like metalloprotease [Lutzomyia longipalpis]